MKHCNSSKQQKITFLSCTARLTRNKTEILAFSVSPAPHREIPIDPEKPRKHLWALMFQKCSLSSARYRGGLKDRRHYAWTIQTPHLPLQPKWKKPFGLNIDTIRSTMVFAFCIQSILYRLLLSVFSSEFEFLMKMKHLLFLRSYDRDKTEYNHTSLLAIQWDCHFIVAGKNK